MVYVSMHVCVCVCVRGACFKATVSFDGFIEKIKAPSQYAADLKVTDAIIYLCKMRGTSLETRRAQKCINKCHSR